jgi:hypothetical protein
MKREILSVKDEPESAGARGLESGIGKMSRRKMIATSATAIAGASLVRSKRPSAADQNVGDVPPRSFFLHRTRQRASLALSMT